MCRWQKCLIKNSHIGKSLVDEGGQESTSVSVQTTAKHSKGNKNGPALPVFNADASKVTIKGMGIKKAFVGKQNQFTVNASEAGNYSITFQIIIVFNITM